MIPRLPAYQPPSPVTQRFLDQLSHRGFCGEIRTQTADRLIAGTDNSIYQTHPQAVVFPRHRADLELLTETLGQPEFRAVKLTPRGGGTGTNGQSLTDGVVLDLSRHLNQILEINAQEGWVRVQPGVVLDQLNEALKPTGTFFAPTLSTSSRATLGGMINTDACGKGSKIYGKTSEHILELHCLLVGGKKLHTQILDQAGWEAALVGENQEIYQLVNQIFDQHPNEIAALPQLDRFITGYNLSKLKDPAKDQQTLNYLIAGSEGTLAVVAEAKLKILPLVKHKELLALRYPDFDQALRGAEDLVALKPAAIETIDGTILKLAQDDPIYLQVGHMVTGAAGERVEAINLVEFIGETAEALSALMAPVLADLDRQTRQQPRLPGSPQGYYRATKAEEIASLWELRKKGVGLLGNAKGKRRPIPFVEDTVVPPKHLADYIKEFRALLESHGLRYGMFGHVDVGCLHVRPALDLKDPKDEALVLLISEEVARLVQKYGGVIWGEHGKGYRSEYTQRYFGPVLYRQLGRIKKAFDPFNQLNPGKITLPEGSKESLVSVQGPLRGHLDRQIKAEYQEEFETSITCNGNGACFNVSPKAVMCPSAKSSGDRVHSPKGRAGLMREWLRRLSLASYQPQERDSVWLGPRLGNWLTLGCRQKAYDFNHEVYQAMSGCLSCKACVTGCPIKVDIPQMKSSFLEAYHSRYPRPLRDYLVSFLEDLSPLQAATPKFSRWLLGLPWVREQIARWGGIIDPPRPSERPVGARIKSGELRLLNLQAPPKGLSAQTDLILVQDSFTSFYEARQLGIFSQLAQALGVRLWLLPHFPNGKGKQVKGFLESFQKLAAKNHLLLERAAQLGVPLVGLDPAVTLTYRDEYPKALGLPSLGYRVLLPQEWLLGQLERLGPQLSALRPANFKARLLGHCTEKALVPGCGKDWKQVFEAFGVPLALEEVGCCGMSGIYGHEKEHFSSSQEIFELSWKPVIEANRPVEERLLADGYSCRSQAKRLLGVRLFHPFEALLERVSPAAHE